jgi:hypothetical protein
MSITALAAAEREYKPIGLGDRQERTPARPSARPTARTTSPFDPMLFGMLATRAMALVRLGHFEEGASWAVKSAARPNAIPHIHAIAAYCLALLGSLEQARAQVGAVWHTPPARLLGGLFHGVAL